MLDPNSTIPEAHEVRVTMRGVRISEHGSPVQVSTRSDFIAPELSGPSTLAIELDKGLTGWTDTEKRVTSVLPVFPKHADDHTVGKSIIRKAPRQSGVVMNRTGPRRNRRG